MKALQKFIILAILILSLVAAYAVHSILKKKIDPKKSVGYFILYLLLHLASVFLIVFGASFLIFQCSNLFFKK